MVIDTDKLNQAIVKHYDEMSDRIDKSVRSDREAIAAFDRIEMAHLKAERLVAQIENLARQFLGE